MSLLCYLRSECLCFLVVVDVIAVSGFCCPVSRLASNRLRSALRGVIDYLCYKLFISCGMRMCPFVLGRIRTSLFSALLHSERSMRAVEEVDVSF